MGYTTINIQSVHDQVHNVSPVIAEWDFKLMFGDPRDEAKFKLTPKGGSLHKDQRVNVQVNARETRRYWTKCRIVDPWPQ